MNPSTQPTINCSFSTLLQFLLNINNNGNSNSREKLELSISIEEDFANQHWLCITTSSSKNLFNNNNNLDLFARQCLRQPLSNFLSRNLQDVLYRRPSSFSLLGERNSSQNSYNSQSSSFGFSQNNNNNNMMMMNFSQDYYSSSQNSNNNSNNNNNNSMMMMDSSTTSAKSTMFLLLPTQLLSAPNNNSKEQQMQDFPFNFYPHQKPMLLSHDSLQSYVNYFGVVCCSSSKIVGEISITSNHFPSLSWSSNNNISESNLFDSAHQQQSQDQKVIFCLNPSKQSVPKMSLTLPEMLNLLFHFPNKITSFHHPHLPSYNFVIYLSNNLPKILKWYIDNLRKTYTSSSTFTKFFLETKKNPLPHLVRDQVSFSNVISFLKDVLMNYFELLKKKNKKILMNHSTSTSNNNTSIVLRQRDEGRSRHATQQQSQSQSQMMMMSQQTNFEEEQQQEHQDASPTTSVSLMSMHLLKPSDALRLVDFFVLPSLEK